MSASSKAVTCHRTPKTTPQRWRWHRAGTGQLPDEALYPSDAQWCGLYDRMNIHTSAETERRQLAMGLFEA